MDLVRSLEKRFPGCYSMIDSLRSGRSWPSPESVVRCLAQRYGLDLIAAAYYAPAVCACAVWLCYKRIYQFEAPLARTLCCTDSGLLPLSFPVDPLQYLPVSGIYIQAPDCVCPDIHGFFCWLSEPEEKPKELYFLFLFRNSMGFIPGFLPLKSGAVLSDSLPDTACLLYPQLYAALQGQEEAEKVVLQQLPLIGPYSNIIHNCTVRSVQLLLYLVSSDADMQIQDDENAPISVGKNISCKLQCTQRRSHIRQGHWHKYWYGPKSGERRLIPKWIPPMIVGEGHDLSVSIKKEIVTDGKPIK